MPEASQQAAAPIDEDEVPKLQGHFDSLCKVYGKNDPVVQAVGAKLQEARAKPATDLEIQQWEDEEADDIMRDCAKEAIMRRQEIDKKYRHAGYLIARNRRAVEMAK